MGWAWVAGLIPTGLPMPLPISITLNTCKVSVDDAVIEICQCHVMQI